MLNRKYYHDRYMSQAKPLMLLAVEPRYREKEEAEAKS